MRKFKLLALVLALGMTACSSTKNTGLTAPSDTQVAVKDTVVSTSFKDQGITLHYTLTGKLDRVEVSGMAPSWKGNVAVLAEADAMDKLVKFVHGTSVSTERRSRIIAKSIDRAQDDTVNRFKSADGSVNFTATELENDSAKNNNNDRESNDNTSKRVAGRLDTTLVNTVTAITAQGRLTGVRKIRDELQQNGRWYVAVYQWSDKDQATSEYIRSRMK